jgi:hypothetical protein
MTADTPSRMSLRVVFAEDTYLVRQGTAALLNAVVVR